jgi:hypothetical protein
MKCKVCLLEESHPEAFQKINQGLNENQKMRPIIRSVNEEFGINITPNNVSRHKNHYRVIKGTQPIDIKEKDVKKTPHNHKAHKSTSQGNAFLSQSSNIASFPQLKPSHEKLVLAYRANGWKSKEAAAKKAGFKSEKRVYEILERPDVQAAIFELKAIDFINLRITGNQIIAGIGEIAHHNEYLDKMYDESGELITDISEWPWELRCALKEVKKEATIINIGTKSDPEDAINVKYSFKFESALSAKKELRKHFMEVDLYKKGEEKRLIHEKTVAIQEMRREKKLSLIDTMKIFEKEGLPFPESLKLEIKDFDWELEKRIRKAEENAKKALTITNSNPE